MQQLTLLYSWEKLRDYHEKYGKIVRLGPNYIAVADKDMLKQILVKDDLQKAPNYDNLAGKISQNVNTCI